MRTTFFYSFELFFIGFHIFPIPTVLVFCPVRVAGIVFQQSNNKVVFNLCTDYILYDQVIHINIYCVLSFSSKNTAIPLLDYNKLFMY